MKYKKIICFVQVVGSGYFIQLRSTKCGILFIRRNANYLSECSLCYLFQITWNVLLLNETQWAHRLLDWFEVIVIIIEQIAGHFSSYVVYILYILLIYKTLPASYRFIYRSIWFLLSLASHYKHCIVCSLFVVTHSQVGSIIHAIRCCLSLIILFALLACRCAPSIVWFLMLFLHTYKAHVYTYINIYIFSALDHMRGAIQRNDEYLYWHFTN